MSRARPRTGPPAPVSWMTSVVAVLALAGAVVAFVRLLRPPTSVTRDDQDGDDADA